MILYKKALVVHNPMGGSEYFVELHKIKKYIEDRSLLNSPLEIANLF